MVGKEINTKAEFINTVVELTGSLNISQKQAYNMAEEIYYKQYGRRKYNSYDVYRTIKKRYHRQIVKV